MNIWGVQLSKNYGRYIHHMFQWYSYVVQKKVYFSSPDNHDLLPTLSDTLGIFPWQTFFV